MPTGVRGPRTQSWDTDQRVATAAGCPELESRATGARPDLQSTAGLSSVVLLEQRLEVHLNTIVDSQPHSHEQAMQHCRGGREHGLGCGTMSEHSSSEVAGRGVEPPASIVWRGGAPSP